MVRAIDDVDELLPLVGAERLLGDEQGLVSAADGQPHPDEEAGREHVVAVFKERTKLPGAGIRVHPVGCIVDRAALRVPFLVGKPQQVRAHRLRATT